MNWYRFKIELSAVASGTLLLTLSSLVIMAFSVNLDSAFMDHPLWMRRAAENPDIVLTGFGLALGIMWMCHCQTFRILRASKAYGER